MVRVGVRVRDRVRVRRLGVRMGCVALGWVVMC